MKNKNELLLCESSARLKMLHFKATLSLYHSSECSKYISNHLNPQ